MFFLFFKYAAQNFLYWQTSLLCIVRELAGGGSVAEVVWRWRGFIGFGASICSRQDIRGFPYAMFVSIRYTTTFPIDKLILSLAFVAS